MNLPDHNPENDSRPGSPQADQVSALSGNSSTGRIRLGCAHCDRTDFDGVSELPNDWLNVTEVQSWEASVQEVDANDLQRRADEWQTHLGICPECNDHQDEPADSPIDEPVNGNSSDDGSEEDESVSVHPIIRQIIDRDCHVGCSHSEVIRHVVSKLKGGFETFRQMALADRELLIDQCVQQHSGNRRLYVEVMSGLRRTTVPKTKSKTTPLTLTGPETVTLMRQHKVTIKELARRVGATEKRVRQIRERGLSDPLAVRDWIQAISGVDPGPIPTPISIDANADQAECSFCGYPFMAGEKAWSYIKEVFCSVSCCRKSRNWLT